MDVNNPPVLRSLKSFKKNFVFEKRIFEGDYSDIYRVRSTENNRLFAIKKTKLLDCVKSEMIRTVLVEEKALGLLSASPFVMFMRESFVDEENCRCLLLEYCNDGSLKDYLKILDEMRLNNGIEFRKRCRILASEMVCALVVMKKERIVHRDLKPHNVCLKNGHVRICDFGTAKLFKHPNKRGVIDMRTRYTVGACLRDQSQYICPEILQGKKIEKYSPDLWSLGVILFRMLTGRFPFEAPSLYVLIKNVINRRLSFPQNTLDEALLDVCSQLLVVDPRARLGFGKNGYKRLKNHEFFRGVDFKALAVGDVENAFDFRYLENNPVSSPKSPKYLLSQSMSTMGMEMEKVVDENNINGKKKKKEVVIIQQMMMDRNRNRGEEINEKIVKNEIIGIVNEIVEGVEKRELILLIQHEIRRIVAEIVSEVVDRAAAVPVLLQLHESCGEKKT